MSLSDGPSDEDELAAIVAATALAVNGIQDSATPDRSPTSAGLENTLTKAKSKRQNVSTQLETGEESIESLDRKMPITGPPQPAQKSPSFAELLESTENAKEGAPTPPKPSPSVKKASSSADKQFKKVASMIPGISSSKPRPPIKATTPPPGQITRQSSARADEWMRQELSRIKKRYDDLKSDIASWETRKKSEAEKKRDKVLKKYEKQEERIQHIAAAARALAEERRRSEELRARDKADTLEATGKLPTACFCF
ncbi:hypothetical protein BT93_B2609 [Corymbia citriodora subsp. variegata]|nr:hypothetical protein BT93_B2609 [Corymbia citriodora subsp. variegata]